MSTNEKLQIVINHKQLPTPSYPYGTLVKIIGHVIQSPTKGQYVEISCKEIDIKIINVSDPLTYPIKHNQIHSLEYIRQYPHLRSGHDGFASILKIRNMTCSYLSDFFNTKNFLNVHTPIITTNNCEGSNESFQIYTNYNNLSPNTFFFRNSTYLTVSAQLHLESIAAKLGNVYTIGPVFRAENSNTRFHLAEFWMLEVEMPFVYDVNSICIIVEECIKGLYNYLANSPDFVKHFEIIAKNNNKNIDFEVGHKKILCKDPFVKMLYSEASQILLLNNEKFRPKFIEGENFSKEHEAFIVKYCNDMPVFILDFPVKLKPFYMKKNENNNAACLDLLFPIVGEICGGSLREDDYDILLNTLRSNKTFESLKWYLDIRKYGFPPMGGFGIGLERLLMHILHIENIRDVSPFPRWHQNCKL
ncbi:unnamed protein product [Gordionus sp. m RMFG-2023]